MLTIVSLADEDFLTAAPAFVNGSVMGTLSATLVAHPSLDDEQVEAAVSALKYGMVPTALHTEACCISTAATTAQAHYIHQSAPKSAQYPHMLPWLAHSLLPLSSDALAPAHQP